MSRATYNITNDKLLVWLDDRLPANEYATAKRCRFVWYPGRKCFAAKWNPEAEDFIRERGIEIEEDDTPDNVEARVDRFAARAEDAAKSAESSADYLANRANTARRQERAAASVEKSLSEAEHWQRRIAASIRHAEFKDRPDVIARRIATLEAEQRKAARESTLQHVARYRVSEFVKRDEEGKPLRDGCGKVVIDLERMSAHYAPDINRAERYVAHLSRRLEYERAMLDAVGGIPATHSEKAIEKGGAVRCAMFRDVWCQVLRPGKATVRVAAPSRHWQESWQEKVTRISEIMTPGQCAEYIANGGYVATVEGWHKSKEIEKQMQAEHKKLMAERAARGA